MPNDPGARAFLIHVAVFAAAVLLCAGINLWLAPQKLWFLWVLLGWGIGVAAHGLAVYLRRTRRRERIFIDRKARGFTVHGFAYAAVVILLLIVNLTVTPGRWWFYWVALGWGAGLAFHGWCAFFKKRKPQPPSAAGRSEAKRIENAIQPTEEKPPRKRAPRKRKPKA
jgi:cyanate permease